jgi:S1-C subfamily serine protease
MTCAARALRFLVVASVPSLVASATVPERAAAGALCSGRYADTLSAMSTESHKREARPAADYAYCLRATAVYEHLSYGRGGKIRHRYAKKVRHGTGFAYRQRGGEWLVATNDHVISFPEVTGDGAEVDGVPPGSRRVRQEVRIVANEADPESPDQVLLAEVVRDEPLDLAVLASRQPLRVVPYRLGRSADLRVGNAVLVRGFPLGAFPAANGGRVIAVGQRDGERAWDHEDFAVDALLNLGSSGSPVLAVSCETGEPEVVGIYHAGYRGAQGLNVVVAVDQLRAVLEELRPSRRAAAVAETAPDPAEARAALARGALVMPFGNRAIRVEREGKGVRFSVLDLAFPLSARVDFSIVDRGHAATGRAAELRDALWGQLALVLRYRAAEEPNDARTSPWIRDAIAARLRERDEDHRELLEAIQAGAEGLALITVSERDPASRAGRSKRPGGGGRELVLGAR